MQQVPVGGMHFDHLETRRQSASRRILERTHHAANAGFIQFRRRRITLIERDRAGRYRGPASCLGLQASSTQPRWFATRLTPRMSQLNSCDRALRLYEAGYSGEWLNVLFAPDAHIFGSDTPLSRNGCRLHHGEPHSARGSAAEVDQVPIVGQPIVGAVLTHRRHNDPIPEGHASDRQRTEQIDVGHFPIMVYARRAAVRRAQAIRDGQLAREIFSSHVSCPRIRESIHDDDDPPPCSTPMESAIDPLIDGMISGALPSAA